MGKCPTCGQSPQAREHQHPDNDWPDDFDIPDPWDCVEEGIWRTKEGEEIPHEDLGDAHLLNIIAMLKRDARPLAFHIFGGQALEAEATKRGLNI